MSKSECEQKPIWERLKGESGRSYHAFTLYRNLGLTRSLAKAAGQLQKQEEERLKILQKQAPVCPQKDTKSTPKLETIVRYLKRWSSAHNWLSRAEAWDAEQDRIAILELQ